MARTCIAWLLLSFAVHAQGPGVSYTFEGDRLGDDWWIEVFGSPGAPGAIGLDSTPGPTAAPFGTLGLGLSPNYIVAPFVVDSSGAFRMVGTLPTLAALRGFTLYLQCALATPGGGVALSAPDSITYRAPGWCIGANNGQNGTRVVFLDGLTNGATWRVIPSTPRLATYLPGRGRYALVQDDATCTIVDERSLITVGAFPVAPANAFMVAASADANAADLLVVSVTPGGPSPWPATLDYHDTTTGVLLSQTPLNAVSTNDPDDFEIVPVPGTTTAWVRTAGSLAVIDYVAGQSIATLIGNYVYDLELVGNRMLALTSSAQILTYEPAFGGLVRTDTIPSMGPSRFLRSGPGSSGPGIWVFYEAFTWPGGFAELDPTSFATRQIGASNERFRDIALSPGGTEWLIVSELQGWRLQALSIANGTLSTVMPVAPQASVLPVVSDTVRRAWVPVNGGTELAVLDTDPTAPTGQTITVPGASFSGMSAAGNHRR